MDGFIWDHHQVPGDFIKQLPDAEMLVTKIVLSEIFMFFSPVKSGAQCTGSGKDTQIQSGPLLFTLNQPTSHTNKQPKPSVLFSEIAFRVSSIICCSQSVVP